MIIRTRLVIICLLLLVISGTFADAQSYRSASFYVCAHEDDWQLFMGSNVYHDINAFDEKNQDSSSKVVIIYTTAGNLNEDDTKTCNCFNPSDPAKKNLPYWMVREVGSKNSIRFASCKIGGYGYPLPYPENTRVLINGHWITRYEFKNTVSYYLRVKAKEYGAWYYSTNAAAGTVDTSTTYSDWPDFVRTIYSIYKTEMGQNIPARNVSFNMPDIDETINHNDHSDHLLAGRAAGEAANSLAQEMQTCFHELLFVDYHIKDLPENIGKPDVQNKAAMTGVYCLALLDYNAWPEWGNTYQEWSARSYFRTVSSCDTNSFPRLIPRVFPNPANNELNIQFDFRVLSTINIRITNSAGAEIYNANDELDPANSLQISTANFANGSYFISIRSSESAPFTLAFDVLH